MMSSTLLSASSGDERGDRLLRSPDLSARGAAAISASPMLTLTPRVRTPLRTLSFFNRGAGGVGSVDSYGSAGDGGGGSGLTARGDEPGGGGSSSSYTNGIGGGAGHSAVSTSRFPFWSRLRPALSRVATIPEVYTPTAAYGSAALLQEELYNGDAAGSSNPGGAGSGRSGRSGRGGFDDDDLIDHIVSIRERRYQLAKKVSSVLLWVTYAVLVILSGFTIYILTVDRADVRSWAYAVAALFVIIAVPLSLHDIHMHMLNYVKPELQRYYIRVLWMVPIYAIESWLALRFQDYKVYIETPRDAYEAYVIYSFYRLVGVVHDVRDRRRVGESRRRNWATFN